MADVQIRLRPRFPTINAGEVLPVEATVTGAEPDHTYMVTWYAWGLGELHRVAGEHIGSFTNAAGHEVAVSRLAGQQPPDAVVKILWDTSHVSPGRHKISAYIFAAKKNEKIEDFIANFDPADRLSKDRAAIDVTRAVAEPLRVTMRRAEVPPTSDQALWTVIRNSSNALSFNKYSDFMDVVLCGEPVDKKEIEEIKAERKPIKARLRLPFPDVDAYRQLKVATEVFMMVNCGVGGVEDTLFGVNVDNADFRGLDLEGLDTEGRRYYRAVQPGDIERYWRQYLDDVSTGTNGRVTTLPYLALIRRKLKDASVVKARKGAQQEEEAAVACMDILMEKLTRPCFLELIWSYWHEEGMLVQTMNAITWRFQNRRGPSDRDPLALIEIDPLRPLNNFIWGYIQDEQHRLTVPRRAYEYDHHYGLTILGKAVPPVRGADSRTRFLEAFHHLLYVCSIFLKEDDDTTVVADGFPVLNALKEVHLLLTQGAHNQYGDLPWTARQEMLMQEWLLARPEFREFLPRRIMVDYPEDWMDSVETMKTLQGWSDASVMHFRDLGVFGEQILLGIRFGAWPSVIESEQAANWVRYWRPEIQGYIHAYRAVTGVDLTDRVDATMPAVLLKRRQVQGLPEGARSLPGYRRGLPEAPRGLPEAQRGLPEARAGLPAKTTR
jgi:hypothetical protein